jgi:hypothetical protein
MAIKVVHGLIDVSAPLDEGSGTAVTIDSETTAPSDAPQGPRRPLSAYHEFNEEIARNLSPRVQAALEKLKRYSAGREREELRDIDQAQQLATMLATRIVEDDEGARSAHSELTTCTAQEHLMQ